MLDEYDFSNGVRGKYANKEQITIRLDKAVLDYFKAEANSTGLPYQALINAYLADCVAHKRKLTWQ